ncbi:MAG TPA: SPOR domain-containing protein, partial [Longimicrobiales bacterium]
LIAKRIKTISSGWDVVATPYAFLVGEYTSRGDAEAKQQDAVKKGIPSYIVALNGDDGSTTYRLYAGAFTGPGDADFMHQILKSAGLPDTLVERTGSIS